MGKIKVLMIEVKNEDRQVVSETLSKVDYASLIGETEELEQAYYILEEIGPDVVLIGSDLKTDRYALTEYINKEYPHIAVIMIEKELKEDTVYKAMFAGAVDFILAPFSSAKLLDSVHRSYQLIKEKEVAHRNTEKKYRRRSSRGRVVTFFSTKGGVGKTFLSVNTAVEIQRLTKKSVCLVDLDLDFGNTSLALDIIPSFTIADMVDEISNLDQDLIESYLIPHDSGIKLLPANAKPLINDYIRAEHVEMILRTLQDAFDYVIVDMPARFYDPVNPAFKIADILLMITTPELSAIRNVKSCIETLESLNFPKSKMKVVLNKADASGQIRPKDVESTVEQKLFSVITADYKLAMLSLNDGRPLVLAKPRSAISKSVRSLAKSIVAEFESAK